jgi:hypothetical protein
MVGRDDRGSAGLTMRTEAKKAWARWAMVAFSGLAAGAALTWTGALHAGAPAAAAHATVDLGAHDLGANVISASFATRVPPAVRKADDAASAQIDPRTGLAQYSEIAQNTGGTLGDYLKTIENMAPALKATPGDFAQQAAALDAAHTAMARAASRRVDVPAAEDQGRSAIQGANEAINAQSKTEEYTDNLVKTGAFERQWGRRSDQRLAVSPGTGTESLTAMPASVVLGDSKTSDSEIEPRPSDDGSVPA